MFTALSDAVIIVINILQKDAVRNDKTTLSTIV